MGNFLPKTTQVETTTKESSNKNMERLKYLAYEFLGIDGRQFEALYSCIAEEINAAREQDLTTALRSMQEKLDQNSKESTTELFNILKKREKVMKELVATKNRNISSEERLQIDAVKDDIRNLKEGVIVLNHQMKVREMAEDEIRIAKNYVKKTASEMKSKLQMKTDNNYNKGEMSILKDDVDVVTGDMCEVREELESQEHELRDVKTAVKNLKDQLEVVTKRLDSVKDVAATSQEGVLCELRNVKEELRAVKEKTGGAKDQQRELTEADLRKEGMVASFKKEVNDKEGSARTDSVQKVRQAMTELEASRDDMAKLINCNNMKRNRDSGYPTFEQNKKLRKQSTRDEHGVALVSRKFVYPSSTSSSESDSSASSFPSKSNLNTNLDFDSDSSDSDSDSSDSDSSDSSDSDSDS